MISSEKKYKRERQISYRKDFEHCKRKNTRLNLVWNSKETNIYCYDKIVFTLYKQHKLRNRPCTKFPSCDKNYQDSLKILSNPKQFSLENYSSSKAKEFLINKVTFLANVHINFVFRPFHNSKCRWLTLLNMKMFEAGWGS